MKVKEITQHSLGDVIAVPRSESLSDVAALMAEQEIGAVLVYGSTGFVGILSERDLTRAIADGADLAQETAAAYMTESPVTIPETAPLQDAVDAMVYHGVRHLAVSRDGEIAGMISARDVLAAASSVPALV